MRKNLYIDFDGVILDTIDVIYKILEEKDPELQKRNLEKKVSTEDFDRITQIISEIDWYNMLKITPAINDSIDNINRLVESNKFDIAILSHVGSYKEMEAKFDFINRNIHGEVDVICVPKSFSKTAATRNCKGDILVDDHSGNLRNWKEAGGISIKFSKEKREHPEFLCVSSLDEIVNLF